MVIAAAVVDMLVAAAGFEFPPTDMYVDRGYCGHDYQGQAQVHIAGGKAGQLTHTQCRRRKRRSAIEPKIGHAKSENRLGRCYLKGLVGDAFNAVLAAAGANLRKLLRLLPCALQTMLLQRYFELRNLFLLTAPRYAVG